MAKMVRFPVRGAARAIVQSLNGTADTQECAITRRSATTALEALNLQVWAAPFTVGSHTLVLNSILDIAHEKNLRGFERMFFHDIAEGLKISPYAELVLWYIFAGDYELD